MTEPLLIFDGTGATEAEAVAEAESKERQHIGDGPVPPGRRKLRKGGGGPVDEIGNVVEAVVWSAQISYEVPGSDSAE